MLADPLTKKKADTSALREMLKTGNWERRREERRVESEY
jgi:hypothetical protein